MAQPPRPGTRRERPELPPKPKEDKTALYIGAGVGGVVLILILFFAMGSSEEPPVKSTPKPKKAAAAPEPEYVRPVKPDTGSILFVCANSGKHEDEEVMIDGCPCGARKKFFVDKAGGGYRCLSCTKVFDNADVKCPKCGRVAVKTHLRPSFN